MPRLSQWFIRISLGYLAAGFTLGGLILANKGHLFYPAAWNLLPIHIEFMFTGWVIMLAMGMVFWILPRFRQGPQRGNERLILTSMILMNAGIWLLVGSTLLALAWLSLAGRLVEALSAAIFVTTSWGRIKPFH